MKPIALYKPPTLPFLHHLFLLTSESLYLEIPNFQRRLSRCLLRISRRFSAAFSFTPPTSLDLTRSSIFRARESRSFAFFSSRYQFLETRSAGSILFFSFQLLRSCSSSAFFWIPVPLFFFFLL